MKLAIQLAFRAISRVTQKASMYIWKNQNS